MSKWTWEFERRAGPLFDGSCRRCRSVWSSARIQNSSECERARTSQWDLRPSLPEHSFEQKAFAVHTWLGYGASLKKAVKEGEYGISLGAFGESLARWDNYIEIDRDLKDAWGIPALRISMTHGDNEAALMEDAGATAAEMLEAAGAKDIRVQAGVEMPGMAIHELGTARMGNDPKKSVLNAFNQAHDVKNLFVMDGASFVSSACQNPTLTMMAVTVRACDHLIGRFRKSEI
ncbi:MAG: hypothetical protein DMG49_00160 [Acidobacteria bacterium]|nr:MAG: hypothetical protein DMG49_00160 [Acidobacteriota bacterium]